MFSFKTIFVVLLIIGACQCRYYYQQQLNPNKYDFPVIIKDDQNIDSYQQLYGDETHISRVLCSNLLYEQDQNVLHMCLQFAENIRYHGHILQQWGSPQYDSFGFKQYLNIISSNGIIKYYQNEAFFTNYNAYYQLGLSSCIKYFQYSEKNIDCRYNFFSESFDSHRCLGIKYDTVNFIISVCKTSFNYDYNYPFSNGLFSQNATTSLLQDIYTKHKTTIGSRIPDVSESYFQEEVGCGTLYAGCMFISPFSKIPLTTAQMAVGCGAIAKTCNQTVKYLKNEDQHYLQQEYIKNIYNLIKTYSNDKVGCRTMQEFCLYQMSQDDHCTTTGCRLSWIYPQCSLHCNNKQYDYTQVCDEILYDENSVCNSGVNSYKIQMQ